MKRFGKKLFGIAFSFIFAFMTFGYAALTDTLNINGSASASPQEGIFITDVEFVSGTGTLDAVSFISSVLNSTVTLGSSSSDTITIRVNFYNNSNQTQMYRSATYDSGITGAYTNSNIAYDELSERGRIIKKGGRLSVDVTFTYEQLVSGANSLDSILNFNFEPLNPDQPIVVVQGDTADTISTIYDGSVYYDGTSDNGTKLRWTNWSTDNTLRGKSSELAYMMFDDDGELVQKSFTGLDLYHFADATGCDLPREFSISYYDEDKNEYVKLTEKDFTLTYNYVVGSEGRETYYGQTVFRVNQWSTTDLVFKPAGADGADSATTVRYLGVDTVASKKYPPVTRITFNETINTSIIKIDMLSKEGYFLGLIEIDLHEAATTTN